MQRQSVQSSTSLINENNDHLLTIASLPDTLFESNYIDHIVVGEQGASAFPPPLQPFYTMIPVCLWLSIKQIHILYFICCYQIYAGVLQYFKFCSVTDGEIFDTSVSVFILIILVVLDMLAKNMTHSQYTANSREENQSHYKVWNKTGYWEQVAQHSLKTGQIIKVQKYLQSNMNLNPANLLPIATASNHKYILIKTTRIDKREEYKKVKVLKSLRKIVHRDENDMVTGFDERLFNVNIDYRFRSHLGSTFQASVDFNFPSQQKIMISNGDIIPCGIPISTEDYVIGIILMHTDHFQLKSLNTTFSKTNKITEILSKYLCLTIVVNLFLLGIIFIISVIMTETTTQFNPSQLGTYSYCFIINLAANFQNTVYISMYLMIYLHRLIDFVILKKRCKFIMNNRIKSIDQLAQTNTLIMDDYFFLERPFNTQDFLYVINNQAPLSQHLNLVLKVIAQSPLLKEHMLGHTMSITKYFRFKKVKSQITAQTKIRILKQRLVDVNCVQIKIRVTISDQQSCYSMRFNDKPVASSLHKLRSNSCKSQVNELITKFQKNKSLLFFIQIMNNERDTIQISNQFYNLFGVMSFVQELNTNNLELIKDESVIQKYNIVIMTTKTWKYINYFMEEGQLKNAQNITIMLQQKQQKQMNYIFKNHLKTLREKKRNNANKKVVILFFNSSMITHLSRKNIRNSLLKLSQFCKYIIFYNCSQYQKQVCATNLFKIFPAHLFMSNYICDYNIFQWSTFSICQKGASSQKLVTAVVTRYKDIKLLIFNEAIKSIQIISCIVNSHIFKNQLLIISHIVAFLLVYRGSIIDLGVSFISELYFYYNFVFTIIPIVFMIIKRPGVYIDQKVVSYFNITDMIFTNFKVIVFGSLMTGLIFALMQEQFVQNLFTTLLLNCIFTSNIFLLFLDDSLNKTGQVIAIVVQIIISQIIIIFIQLFNTYFFQFIEIGTNFHKGNIWFYLTTFLIAPGISFLVLFAFSAGREIRLIENDNRQFGLSNYSHRMESLQTLTEEATTEIVLKVNESKGKHMSFLEEQL